VYKSRFNNKSQQESEGSWIGELGRTVVFEHHFSFRNLINIVEARWIPSESMVPTLKINDKLIIAELSQF